MSGIKYFNPNRPSKLYAESVKARNRKVSLIEKEKNTGGLFEGVGYVGGKTVLGAMGIFEGVGDILAATGDLVTGNTDMAQYRFLDNKTAQLSQGLDEWYNPDGFMQFMGDVGGGIGDSSVLLIPYAGVPLFATGVVGQGISSAAAKTGKVGWNELLYGAASGGVEFGLEAVTGGVGGTAVKSLSKLLGKTAVKETSEAVAKTGAKGLVKTTLKEIGKGAAGEFAEEATSTAIDPLLQRISGVDPEAEAASFGDIFYSGAVGAVSGGLMSAPGAAVNYKTNERRGASIERAGKTDRVVSSARGVASYLSGIQTEAETTAKEFANENAIFQARARHQMKKDAKRSAQFAEALAANIAAWDGMSEAQRSSSAGHAVLGEMQINMLYAQINAEIEAKVSELSADDAQLTKIAEYVREQTGKEYSVEDLRADRDGMLSQAAGLLVAEKVSEDMRTARQKNTARVGAYKEGKQVAKDIRRAVKGTQTGENAAQGAKAGTDGNLTAEQRNEQKWENKAADLATLRRALNGTKLSEDIKDTVISTYYPVKGMRAEDYATAFAIATIYGRSGADKAYAYKDNYVSRLPQKVVDAAYSLGQKQKSGAEAENKKASADAEGGKKYSYDEAVDDELLEFYRSVLSMENKSILSKRKKKLGRISEKHARLIEKVIKKETGKTIDVSGYDLYIDGGAIQHIEDRHGKNGDADQSMKDPRDVARIGWAANNAESAHIAREDDGSVDYDTQYKNSDQSPSPKVMLEKEIGDSKMIVVECVPDSSAKRIYIVSARIEKGSNGQVLNMQSEDRPQPTSKTLRDGIATINSIPHTDGSVNTSDEKSFRRSSREGRVIRAEGVNMQKLSDRQYSAYKAAEIMARALGTDIVIHADLGQTKNGKAVNGYFDEKTGQIHVNINAMRDGEHIALYTLSHEVTHYVKAWSGEKYAALAEFVFERLADGQSRTPVPTVESLIDAKVEALRAAGLLPKGATEVQARELAREEVVCDGMELILADGEVLGKLAARDKTLWEKIKDVVLRVVDLVKAAYATLSGTSKTAQVLSDTMDSLDNIKQLFYEAVTEAGDARRSGKDADVTGIRYSIKQTQKIDWDKQLQAVEQKSINGSNSLYIGEIISLSQMFSNLPFAMNQSDYRKPRRTAGNNKNYSAHAVPYDFFAKLPKLLDSAPMIIDGAEKATVITSYPMNDTNGKASYVIVGVHKKQNMENDIVNQIKSAYPWDDFADRLVKAAEQGMLVIINKNKAEQMLATIGIQPSEVSRIVDLAKDIVTYSDSKVNTPSKKFSVDDANTGIEPFTSMDEYAVEGEILPEKPATDREILSGALEGAVRSKGEYNALKEYREQLTELDAVVEKRKTLKKAHAEVVKRINELKGIKKRMFEEPSPDANGTDMVTTEAESDSWIDAEIVELKKAKDEIKRQIDDADSMITEQDKKLLKLQATKPIRELIQHAKKQAANKTRQRDAEKLQRTKESYEKRLFKVKEREERRVYKAKAKYKKMYDDRQLGKDTTAARNSLRKEIDRLNSMLFVPNKKWHIPPEMQRAVAEALSSTNMDTVGVQNIAKINAEIERLTQRANKGADVSKALNEQLEKREKWERKAAGIQEQMTFLSQLYAQITASGSDTVQGMFDEEISGMLSEHRRVVGDTPIADMTLVQLRSAKEFYNAILTRVGTANQLFLDGKQAELDAFVEDTIEEVEKSKKPAFMKPKPNEVGVLSSVRKYIWKALKPVYAFEIFGSDSMMSIFWSLQRGEGVWAKDCADAEKKFKSVAEKHHYWDWDFESKREFEVANGKKVKLTLGEILSLYALINRPPAYHHLTNGGFAFHSETVEKGKWGEERVKNDFERYRLDDKTAEEITRALSDEQRAFADDMIEYLSVVMGEKGNEVSVQLYGAALFGDKHYFPMEVLDTQVNSQTGRTGDSKITNKSMTKQIAIDPEERATNTLVLRDFMEVWTRHVNDMSLYHGMALATENLSKILNYRRSAELNKDTGEWSGTPYKDDLPSYSFKDSINKEYGPEAIKYIEQLLRDLNGGVRSGTPTNAIDKGISLFKKSAVMASWSTIIQQPTSICRAWELIDAKYFVNTGYNPQKSRELWEELKEYAPVAIVKEMGGFDTGVGQATGDYIMEREYSLKEKPMAFIKDKNYRDRVFGYGAAKADQLAWLGLWEACKKEQTDLHKELSPDSEELLTLAGERFTEAVVRTQVYDSTLSRSEMMRSKDTGWKMAMSFMAEPTTMVNMLVGASVKLQRGDVKTFRRSVGCIAGSLILNAILASLVYAARDDDEEKNYGEKYLESLTSEITDAFNPLTVLPYVKDIWSLAQGYDVERTDIAVFADLIQSVQDMSSSEKTWAQKSMNLGANVGTFFGLPTRNLYRDARGIYNVLTNADGDGNTAVGYKYAFATGAAGIVPLKKFFGVDADISNGQQLYNAIISGDKAHYNRVLKRFDSEVKLNNALRTALRDNDERIRDAAQARVDGDISTYSKLVREVMAEGFFDEKTVKAAVNAEYNDIMKDIESGAEDNKDEESTQVASSIYNSSMLNSELDRGDFKEAKVILDDLVASRVAIGKTEKAARSAVRSSVTSYWKKKYLAAREAKDAAELKRIRSLLTRSGLYGDSNDVLKVTEKWFEDYRDSKKTSK
ncbi:MAG: hypothetical protein E7589_01270 [Ruminococcaceae bacterium]|nr:hypothetical protein [Oscillospiraceae bacterium]